MTERGVLSGWAVLLLLVALVALLVGVGAGALAGEPPIGWAPAALLEWLRELWSVSWRWLGWVGGGLSLLGLLLGAGLALFPAPPERPLAFEQLHTTGLRDALREVEQRVHTCTDAEVPNVVLALDELLRGAAKLSASDLHFSPTPGGFRVTYRVQGSLHDVANLRLELAPLLTTRVKVLARLDTAVRATPQDGRLVVTLDGTRLEARVSTLPTESGERVVLRLVRGSLAVPQLESLGFSEEVLRGVTEVLAKPQGVLFVTGPVGSGKTTTLYAALEYVSRTRGATTTCVTLEDPIELQLPFATQTQMNQRAGLTFAGTLRSVLRQDPNVLMVGEIRDQETADIAMQAGLTGHLLLTTVHGEGAAGPFARMMDMQIEPFVLASATLGCLAQRLVRTLCTACRRPAEPEPLHRERFARHGVQLPPGTYYEPVGCPFCEHQGFTGRLPIAEVLVLDAELRQAVHQRLPTRDIYEEAVRRGMTPLLESGLERALAGETSLAEVLRVAG